MSVSARSQIFVAHAAILAAGGDAPLPVDRLARVKITGMPEAGLTFDALAATAIRRPAHALNRITNLEMGSRRLRRQ